MQEQIENMRRVITAQLVELGWEDQGGTALAVKGYPTAVGYKTAFVYLADYGPDNDAVLLQGDYMSEGSNSLSDHPLSVLKASTDEHLRQKAREFAKNADKVIMDTYAARLMAFNIAENALGWVNQEIPAYLSQFGDFEAFDKATAEKHAPRLWKMFAYAMAKERWSVDALAHLPV